MTTLTRQPVFWVLGIAACFFLLILVDLSYTSRNPVWYSTALLIAVAAVIPVFACISRFGRARTEDLDFFQPGVVVAILFYLYIVWPAIRLWVVDAYDPSIVEIEKSTAELLNYVLMLAIVGMFAFGMGYRSRIQLIPTRLKPILYSGRKLDLTSLRQVAVIFLIVGLSATLWRVNAISASGSIIEQFSPAARREADVGVSQFVVVFESMFGWGALLLLFGWLIRLRHSRSIPLNRTLAVIFLVLTAMVLAYIVGAKRSAVMPFILMPLIWYHYLLSKVSVAKGISLVFLGFLLMAGLLMLRVVLPVIARGDSVFEMLEVDNLVDIAFFYFATSEFSTIETFMTAAQDRGELLLRLGGSLSGSIKYNFETFFAFVPRAIWPDKPIYEDVGHVFFEWITGGSGVGFAITAFGTLYLFGHIFGLVFGMFVIGVISKSIYRFFSPIRGNCFDVFFYAALLWLGFQFIRFGTLGFTFLFFIQTQAMGILAALWLARNSSMGSNTSCDAVESGSDRSQPLSPVKHE